MEPQQQTVLRIMTNQTVTNYRKRNLFSSLNKRITFRVGQLHIQEATTICRNSSVGIAIRYGLDGPGIESH
jgi:hypothetical protein